MMFAKSHNYGKLWRDYAGPASRATAYAYWLQAQRFERAARERGDTQTAEFQRRIRIKNENRLIELDAMEGGGI